MNHRIIKRIRRGMEWMRVHQDLAGIKTHAIVCMGCTITWAIITCLIVSDIMPGPWPWLAVIPMTIAAGWTGMASCSLGAILLMVGLGIVTLSGHPSMPSIIVYLILSISMAVSLLTSLHLANTGRILDAMAYMGFVILHGALLLVAAGSDIRDPMHAWSAACIIATVWLLMIGYHQWSAPCIDDLGYGIAPSHRNIHGKRARGMLGLTMCRRWMQRTHHMDDPIWMVESYNRWYVAQGLIPQRPPHQRDGRIISDWITPTKILSVVGPASFFQLACLSFRSHDTSIHAWIARLVIANDDGLSVAKRIMDEIYGHHHDIAHHIIDILDGQNDLSDHHQRVIHWLVSDHMHHDPIRIAHLMQRCDDNPMAQ
jgi:hypothetical protein